MEPPQYVGGDRMLSVEVDKPADEPHQSEQPGRHGICDNIDPDIPPGRMLGVMAASADRHNEGRVEMRHVGSKPRRRMMGMNGMSTAENAWLRRHAALRRRPGRERPESKMNFLFSRPLGLRQGYDGIGIGQYIQAGNRSPPTKAPFKSPRHLLPVGIAASPCIEKRSH